MSLIYQLLKAKGVVGRRVADPDAIHRVGMGGVPETRNISDEAKAALNEATLPSPPEMNN